MRELFSYAFMQNAFIAILIISPMLGILGTMVVHKQMAYFSDALGHSALTGVAIGAILGVTTPNLTMVAFGILFALLLNRIKFRTKAAVDTVISVCASTALAIGLAILSRGSGFSKYSSLLVGDVLSIRREELPLLAFSAILTLVYWGFCLNSLTAASIHPALAKSRRIPVRLTEDLFVVIISILVMLSIRWIGVLLINALLILPAASAKNLASNMRQYHVYTVLIALFCGILGLFVSYCTNVATGPMIVIYAGIIYFATYLRGTRHAYRRS